MKKLSLFILCTAFLWVLPSIAGAVILTVYGNNDPWLAGMPNGSRAANNDVAPAQSPSLVTGLPVPAAVWLFGSGLIGLVIIRRKFKS